MRKPVLHIIFDSVSSISPAIRRSAWKIWYSYVTELDKNAQVTFMNYGYADPNNPKKIRLKKSDEKDRYCIQLYHHVASAVSLKGRDVLEVGCGRGGGSSYIIRYLKPISMTGMDFSKKAVEFCKKHYSAKGLSFSVGDAESLPFKDRKFDVVINIESSHCYGNMARFLGEVFRIIRPNGYFLFADFRYKDEISYLRNQFILSGFEIAKEERITSSILNSLDIDNKRKLGLIEQKVPKLLQKPFFDFAGLKGTPIYESFRNGDREYLNFVLKKGAG